MFGASGCGKSTVLNLVAGLAVPDSGEILIDGTLVTTASKILVAPEQRSIGMVFQDLALWPHMTVAENIEFGLRAKRMPLEQRGRRVREMVDLVRLRDYLDTLPAQLSGGQQQRVALARALALAPRILLMDEPMSSLDEELNKQLRREILQLHDEFGFTLVYVTHSQEEASTLATRIVYLRQGRIERISNAGEAA